MALQRIGRTPPPAILSRPEDALAAIRGSILAGAVLPDIRGEAEKIADDLAQLTALTAEIETEHDSLRPATLRSATNRRASSSCGREEGQREQTEAALASEHDKAAELAGKAESLQSLIGAWRGRSPQPRRRRRRRGRRLSTPLARAARRRRGASPIRAA